MGDDLGGLPLKSMELPSRTVAKLKPLALETVADLYAVPVERLVVLGLGEKELLDIAEAAPDFGLTWTTPAEIAAAFAAKAAPESTPATDDEDAAAPPAKVRGAARPKRAGGARTVWPDDFAAALASDPSEPVDLARAQQEGPAALAIARWRLVRRMRIVRAPSIGGAERSYLVAFIDVTQSTPAAPTKERTPADPTPVFLDVAAVVHELLDRLGVHVMATAAGPAATFAIAAKSLRKVEALVAAHRERFDGAPTTLGPIAQWHVVIAHGLLSAGLWDEVKPLVPVLSATARDLSSAAGVEALRALAGLYEGAGTLEEGAAALAAILSAEVLARVARGGDAATALVAAARVAAVGGAAMLATVLLRHACAVDERMAHLPPLRGELLDEPRFDVLHGDAAFRALFRGYPVFEARLGKPRAAAKAKRRPRRPAS